MGNQRALAKALLVSLLIAAASPLAALTKDEIDNLPTTHGASWLLSGFLYVVPASGLYVRSQPDPKSPSVALLKKGDFFHFRGALDKVVTIEGIASRWLVYDGPAGQGYVYGGFVSTAPPLLVYTRAQVATFEQQNRTHAEQELALENARREAAKNGQFFQACAGGCGGGEVDWKRVELEAGCKPEKKAAIRNLLQSKQLSLSQAIEKFDDPYCEGLFHISREGLDVGGSVYKIIEICVSGRSFFDDQ